MEKERIVIREDVEIKFVEMIIDFAKEEGLTINNIDEAVDKVKIYMEENATVKEEQKDCLKTSNLK